MSAPLAGISVLEVSDDLPGAFAGMLLSDLGADVVLLEPDAGGRIRAFVEALMWHRGKKSVRLDVQDKKHPDVVRRLLQKSDVLLESVVDSPRFLSPQLIEAVREANPRLIHCLLTGFPDKSAENGLPGRDSLVAASAGILDQLGFGKSPSWLKIAVISHLTGMFAATSIASALMAVSKGAPAPRVRLSAFEVALTLRDDAFVTFPGVSRLPVRGPQGDNPLSYVYECSEHWIVLAVSTPQSWVRFAEIMGLMDLVGTERYKNAPLGLDQGARRHLATILTERFKQKSPESWVEIFRRAGIPCALVQDLPSWLVHPQLSEMRALVETTQPELGSVLQPGPLLKLGEGPETPVRPAPKLGENTTELLTQLRIEEQRIRPKTKLAGPTHAILEGVRVIEFCTHLSGPYTCMLLSALGADVIKVEPLDGDPIRALQAPFMSWNRGKRGLSLDFETDSGREIIKRLIRTADVFVENRRPSSAKRLGLDYDQVRAINPRIIHCAISSYGEAGPLCDEPGIDSILQALSGTMLAQGGIGQSPVWIPFPFVDYAAAALSAYGIILALLARQNSGEGVSVATSLLQSSLAIQSNFIVRLKDISPFASPLREYKNDEDALNTVYRSLDGWVCIGCTTEQELRGLSEITDFPGTGASSRWNYHLPAGSVKQTLRSTLESLFATHTNDEWVRVAKLHGVPLAVVRRLEDLRQDLGLLDQGLVHMVVDPDLGTVQLARVPLGLSSGLDTSGLPAPRLGQHSVEILSSIGFSADQIKSLEVLQVVRG